MKNNQKGFVNIVLIGVIFLLVAIGGYFVWKGKKAPIVQQPILTSTVTQTNTPTPTSTSNEDISSWKTYSNSQLGFILKYPTTWTKSDEYTFGNEVSGTVTHIDFTDIVSGTSISVEYHPAPTGTQLYNSFQEWQTTSTNIKVAGNNALEASFISNIDSKGHTLNPPLREILVDLLDKQKADIQFQFTTPVPNENPNIMMFNGLLSTFKFIN